MLQAHPTRAGEPSTETACPEWAELEVMIRDFYSSLLDGEEATGRTLGLLQSLASRYPDAPSGQGAYRAGTDRMRAGLRRALGTPLTSLPLPARELDADTGRPATA